MPSLPRSPFGRRSSRTRAPDLAPERDEPRVEVVEADVLETPLAAVAKTSDFLLVGNVPYYITTPILFHALQPPRARRAVFLV